MARGRRQSLFLRLLGSVGLSAGKTRIAIGRETGFGNTILSGLAFALRCKPLHLRSNPPFRAKFRLHKCVERFQHFQLGRRLPYWRASLGFSTLTKVPPFCPFRMMKRTCWPSQSSVSSVPSCRTIAPMSHLSKLARNENLAVPFLNSITSPLNFGELTCLHEIIFPVTTPFFCNFLNKRSSSRGNRSCCAPFFTYAPTFIFSLLLLRPSLTCSVKGANSLNLWQVKFAT